VAAISGSAGGWDSGDGAGGGGAPGAGRAPPERPAGRPAFQPAPEHTFVDPATGTYTGTIDFGDAYISHPALDLRRWRDPADREALFVGYVADAPVDDEFVAVWRVTQALADLAVIAAASEHREEATAHLDQLLREW